jgi:DNA-binding NarL/FixJ family response regulator
MIRVVIADDQGLVRLGLRKVLEIEPDTTVVGEAVDGEQAVQVATRLQPDVVLMDIRMPSLDGIEATRRLVRTHPSIRVLMLTTFGLDTYVYESLRAGASGFMFKDAPPEVSRKNTSGPYAEAKVSPQKLASTMCQTHSLMPN